jgi:hypothetical protein
MVGLEAGEFLMANATQISHASSTRRERIISPPSGPAGVTQALRPTPTRPAGAAATGGEQR